MFQMQNKREQAPYATGKPAVALEEGAEGRVDAADKGDRFQEEEGRTTGCTGNRCLFTKEKPGVREYERLEKFTASLTVSLQEVTGFSQRKHKVYMTHFQISVAYYPYF